MSDAKSALSEISLIRALYYKIDRRNKVELKVLLVLMIFSAILEMVSISSFLPFLGVLSAPDVIMKYKIIDWFYIHYAHSDLTKLQIFFGLAFIIINLISAGLRFLVIRKQTIVGHGVGYELSTSIYSKWLQQPYLMHAQRNSSEILSAITTKASWVVHNSILPAMNIISGLIIIIAVLISLLIINFEIVLYIIILLCLVYTPFVIYANKKFKIYSSNINVGQTSYIKTVSESLRGIRDIIINNNYNLFINRYKLALKELNDSVIRVNVYSFLPRYIIEPVGIIALVVSSIIMLRSGDDPALIVALLGSFGLAAQRLAPNFQQIYQSWASMIAGKETLRETVELLNLPNTTKDKKVYKFENTIKYRNLCFHYSENEKVIFEGVNLDVDFGDRIGVVGESGSGKSTLVDVLIGLIEPIKGVVEIDGNIENIWQTVGWLELIAHVPQDVFIFDGTLAENIAISEYGKPIDYKKISRIVNSLGLNSLIDERSGGYDSLLGEDGSSLSGGQRQKIAIARALYKDAKILVLDEPTSALDYQNEMDLIEAINSLDSKITVIMIAHKYQTLKYCNKIIKLNKGSIKLFKNIGDMQNE